MNEIQINFQNLINEMREKEIILFIPIGRNNWFLQDKENNIYQAEKYYAGSYLDQFILGKLTVKFIRSDFIIDDRYKEIWDVKRVNNFIKNIT
ncbi:hypothetical protein [Enterococcus mundtii]|uniref:hypothetical protein n=1 Tax=Enterococcus mundtii TaxID=53346 RepID=UPI001A971771|nr:hypothetical protein [Enterococcus mundtii]MBO1087140.1 hypothetical protein [Enterococcus mundtii]